MTKTTKSLQDLTIRDNFLFGAVMLDEEICRHTIELALGFPIERISVIKERSLQYHPEYHGIRLDIYAQDENHTHYNVEMQVLNQAALTKRGRYYHSQMDMESLSTGINYSHLPDCFVIFICCFDPFGEGLYRYTFTTQGTETGQTAFDGIATIYLNTEGKNDDSVSPELVRFLRYIRDSILPDPVAEEDSFIQKIEEHIRQIKANREMGDRYMLLEIMLQEKLEEGRIEAHVENILSILEEFGEIPSDVQELIQNQTDLNLLKQWLKTAVRSESLEEFLSRIQNSTTKQ